MLLQAPVEFALHQQVQRLSQSLRNGADLLRRCCPVLTADAVTATDRLLQQTATVDQRDGHTIDLGLCPDILPILQPRLNGGGFVKLVQTGVRDRMSDGA